MGIDMATKSELIAGKLDIEGIRLRIGADSLAYLSHDGLLSALDSAPDDAPYCSACFTGDYPVAIDDTSPDTLVSIRSAKSADTKTRAS